MTQASRRPSARQGGDIQLQIRDLLIELIAATIEPPRSSGLDEVIIRTVNVATAGTSVQGPDISVPAGYPVVVRLRHHNNSMPIGYVGFSRNAVANVGTRSHLIEGESLAVRISNLKNVWLDSSSSDTTFELIVER